MAAVFLARGGIALQGGVNASLSTHVGSTHAAAALNFIGGLALRGFIYVIRLAFSDVPSGTVAIPPWLYLGGVFGASIVVAANIVIPRIGTLTYGLCMIAGQVIGGIILDGLSPIKPAPATWLTVTGGALALVAAAVGATTFRVRRRAPATGDEAAG